MKNLGHRIKEARIKAKLTQVELAKRLNIAYQTLNKYEKGHRIPDSEILRRIAIETNCNPTWLLTGEGEMFQNPPVPEALPVQTVPVLGKVPAGFPEHVAEEVVDYIALPNVPPNSYALIVKGDSMSPTIKDGDYILFVPITDIKNGDVVVVLNEWGETILKRFRKKDNEVFLTSDNPEYPVIKPNEHYKIVGKVTKIWREIKF
ncbi:XRE family transcriptional regulator [Thermodesulfovibrio sp.]|uniref:LexA family protein n=1 Tax=Thermodesulfovibrio sp. TaxID=2067987 RepID=UPI0030A01D6E